MRMCWVRECTEQTLGTTRPGVETSNLELCTSRLVEWRSRDCTQSQPDQRTRTRDGTSVTMHGSKTDERQENVDSIRPERASTQIKRGQQT
jgi:hypothetical protein